MPPHWVAWETKDITVGQVGDIITTNTDIPAIKRGYMNRKNLSDREKEMLYASGISITSRGGRKSQSPDSPVHAAAYIVQAIHGIIDRETTSCLYPRTPLSGASVERKAKVSKALHYLEQGELINAVLLSTFTEPSQATMRRFFSLASIYGAKQTSQFIDRAYEEFCSTQRNYVKDFATMMGVGS